MMVKSALKRILLPRHVRALKKCWQNWRARLCSDDLIALAQLFGTDKWGAHCYAQHYNRHFGPLRKRSLLLLEIGIGGYDNPLKGGASLRAWKWFFPHSQIVGIDIHDKTALEEKRIRIYEGSQVDAEFLQETVAQVGPPDIIIDDGSHQNDHVIATFKTLFPLLRENGIYVIEDTQTSYWPSFGGLVTEVNSDKTMLGFFKGLIDGLNHREYLQPEYVPTYYDKNIVSMHLYHNLIFIYKGNNDEQSNLVRAGKLLHCAGDQRL